MKKPRSRKANWNPWFSASPLTHALTISVTSIHDGLSSPVPGVLVPPKVNTSATAWSKATLSGVQSSVTRPSVR